MNTSPQLKIGCCGFAGSMADYFSRFSLVEVQQTFYKLPRLQTALKWRSLAPPQFEFALKASQLITHPSTSPTYRRSGLKLEPDSRTRYGLFRPSDEVQQAWEATRQFAHALEANVIVFQCPPSFRETPENVENIRRFFKSVHASDFVLAWEPRGDWSDHTILNLCEELGLVHCVDPFLREPLHGQPRYFRLHGGPQYRHEFTHEELRHVYDITAGTNTYVLFNNLNMRHDAHAFDLLLKQEQMAE